MRPPFSPTRLLSTASAAIDRTAARILGDTMARRAKQEPRSVREMENARARLLAVTSEYQVAVGNDLFFPAPSMPTVEESSAGRGANGSRVIDLSFASEYLPFSKAATSWYQSYLANNTAHARLWTSSTKGGEQARPTIVMIHGFGAGDYWMIEQPFEVSYWLHHGFDVCAFQLPFHGKRTPEQVSGLGRLSGPLFPSANIVRTNEAFGQAIYDLRSLALYLQRRGASSLHTIGMSLGGYTAALWASVSPELFSATAMIPATSMAELMWAHGAKTNLRKRARDQGVSEDLLDSAFAVHSPLARTPLVAQSRRFVIAGEQDHITPPEQAERLAAHWQTETIWFSGGHLAQLGRHSAYRKIRIALQAALSKVAS